MKVTVIGGGSSYTPELINGFLERVHSFPLTELWLMDVLPERLEIVGRFAQRMVEAKGAPFEVILTTDQRKAVEGASYVTTQLRVGWMQARREDEYLGRRHGLIGQETTGVGGMAKALRTIPIVLRIAKDMRELAEPGALLVNFTNPAGLVTEALARHVPDVLSVGVCNVPITVKMDLLKRLEEQSGLVVEAGRAELNTLGLNHLSWHRGFTVDGEELWSRIIEPYVSELREQDEPEWDPLTIESLGMIPNYYLQYYYYTGRKLAAQKGWPPSRAEDVMGIEEKLLAQYGEPDRTEPPAGLMERGAVAGWPVDWVLEMSCLVGRDGIKPIVAEPLSPACFGLLSQVKMFELLTVEAAVHGDRNAAYQALLTHPLGQSADKVQAVLEDMLATHRTYLPQFWD